MGMSFCNLHIKFDDLNVINGNVSNDYIGCKISEGWISVYEKEPLCDWFKILALGRAVSQKLKLAVIAVNYMDDDVFSACFYCTGSRDCNLQKQRGWTNI